MANELQLWKGAVEPLDDDTSLGNFFESWKGGVEPRGGIKRIQNVFWLPPTAWDFVSYDGLVIPPASLLFHDSGVHGGSDNAATYTKTGAGWTVNEHANKLCRNTSDGSQDTILSNTADTVTLDTGLAGGTDNDFDVGDDVEIVINADTGDQIVHETAVEMDDIVLISSATIASDGGMNSSNPLVCPAPAGIQDGDILLAIAVYSIGGGNISAPPGWTQVDTNNTNQASGIFYKVASGESGTYDFTTSLSSLRDGSVVMGLFRDVDGGVLDVTYVNPTHFNATVSDASPLPDPITTLTDNALVVLLAVSVTAATGSATPPASYTQAAEVSHGTAFMSVMDYTLVATAGVETPADQVLPGIDVNYSATHQYTIALKKNTAIGSVLVSAKGVPSIIGPNGKYSFDYKIRDLTDSKVSTTQTATVNA